jgi:MFS family permease
MIGDLYSVAERAKVQGYVASVWAISSVVGPTLGGLFSDYLSWRWIFYVNIPLAAVAAWMVIRRFHEDVHKTPHTIDYRGAILLTLGSSLVILGLLEGGVIWDWDSLPSIGVLAGGGVLLVLFGLAERRAAEPILPGWIFRRRILNSTNLVSLTVGVMLIGLTSYVPLFTQGVLGTSAVVAGFALAAMTVGWPLSASLAGRIYLRLGFRTTALFGAAVTLVGAGLLTLLEPQSSVWQVAATCFVVGVGLGLVASPTLVAAQATVDWKSRGVVTGTNMFARSMGSALGIAIFGAIANASLSHKVNTHGSSTAAAVPAATLDTAIGHVFWAAAVTAVVLLAAVTLMPRREPTPR